MLLLRWIVFLVAYKATHGQSFYGSGNDFSLERPRNLPAISHLEVMCGKDHMTVQLAFLSPFQGMVFSKGQYGHPSCMYVQPGTSGTHFEFKIYYSKCGTKPDMGGRFYENTVIIQYDPDLIEVWDEAKRLRCEWYNDYEKTASKPPVVIADLEVVELNFRGDNVDCWMEIQDGKGPWAAPVTGIVPLGSTLTMVVAINDKAGEFDMRVKSCEASDGKNPPIYLSDERGCVLRPKMISPFMKLRNNDGRATVITYAHFHAFKFPDTMSVYLRCKVEICRYGCPDHCQNPIAGNPIGHLDTYGSPSEQEVRYALPSDGRTPVKVSKKSQKPANASLHHPTVVQSLQAADEYRSREGVANEEIEFPLSEDFPWGPRNLRRKRRHVNVLSRHVRETNIGVTTNYQVISEADLEFVPSSNDGITVFKGHREDVVYGICLPAPGFTALFVLLAMCTVISVLVAGFMCHHRQIQKDSAESPASPHFVPFSMGHFLRNQLVSQIH